MTMEEFVLRSLITTVTALTLSTQACATPAHDVVATPPATLAAAPSSPSPSPFSPDVASSPGGVFSGTREVAISMESGPPAYLVVGADGKVIGNGRLTERSIFVLVPIGARHRIKTAFADDSCVGESRHADGPPTLVMADCDPGAEGQLFRFIRTGETDSQGRRRYRIMTASGSLTFNSLNGLHVQNRDHDASVTGFAVTDQGPA